MCRLLAYLGESITISSILLQPAHSLIKQSTHSQESHIMVNGDGFGMSWYVPNHTEPALFKTLNPAWNEPNLHDLCKKTQSHCINAHIRAATNGNISRNNSHPCRFKNLSMMHNGTVGGFIDIKRPIRNLLCDDTYNWIEGQTDSEHFFALVMNFMMKLNFDINTLDGDEMKSCFEVSVATILDLLNQHSDHSVFSLNTIITNGDHLLATRYANDPNEMRTLYYMTGNHFECTNNGHKIIANHCEKHTPMTIIASERLSDHNQDWLPIPASVRSGA